MAIMGGGYDYCINFDSMEISSSTRLMMFSANARLNVGYDSGPFPELSSTAAGGFLAKPIYGSGFQ